MEENPTSQTGSTSITALGAAAAAGALAAGATAAVAARLGVGSPTTADTGFFDDPTPDSVVDLGDRDVDLPIHYLRTDCFMGLFSADASAVRSLLPSERLHPIHTSPGRVAVGVQAFNYIRTGVGRYGEIAVAALCRMDRRPPPLIGLLAESSMPGFGAFVMHLPVTTRIARDAGRDIWGYPKFTSDMHFGLTPENSTVVLAEGDREVLRLEIPRKGRISTDHRPVVTFSEHHGDLVRTEIPTRGTLQTSVGRPGGQLELGDHPVAEGLADLAISREPIATKTYLDHSAILPRGTVVARAQRSYQGFVGSEADCGDHTVTYGDGSVEVVSRQRTDDPEAVAVG